ncbi:type IV pilus modification PilV family protein [Acetivibrio cellulolyticus]|uniref:type IV pilus modification PilV family protein n=1 Tax=Acetivibrio cellulolyticus TaxID=35830 RepID=UPI0001E2DE5E|nr:hypothetical protein [Acetivibrio cellulolyticus]
MKKIGKKGTTLVEVIASLVIVGIILTPITSIFYMGYKNYFVENDRMTAQQAAKDVLEIITKDLRFYENKYTEVDAITGKSLIIKDGTNFPGDEIVYSFDEGQKMILRNNVALLEDNTILITNFSVQEIKLSDYDSSLIKISVTVKSGKSDEINMEGSYRRKYK